MSKRPNENNERIKRRFLEYRKHARQLAETSLDRDIAALERFDAWNGRKDFARFHIQQAMEFRAHLEKAKGPTGIRVKALTTLRIKHVDLAEKSVTQNPREVATKFGKPIYTLFARKCEEAEAALKAWLEYLEDTLLYGPDDPLFPATAIAAQSNTGFEATGFKRTGWQSSEPVRKIVRSAFEAADQPNYGPHAFRHMLACHAVKNSKSVAELVANSQNLEHTDVLTTLRSYGQIDRDRQRELVTGLVEG